MQDKAEIARHSEVICKQCGKTFIYYNKGKHFCSWECYVAFSRKNLEVKDGDILYCEFCKKEYKYKQGISGKRFCSYRCSVDFLNKGKEQRYCVICGKEILKSKKKTCSKECLLLLKEKKLKNSFIEETCIMCGDKFEKKFYSNKKTCSHKCLKDYLSFQRKGEKNSNYKDGIKMNGVKKKCQNCGKEFTAYRKGAVFCSKECSGQDSTHTKFGRLKEREAAIFLRKNGYYVMKSAASLGVFDLIAFNKTDMFLIQVKSTRIMLKASSFMSDFRKMQKVEAPIWCKKMLWLWQFGSRTGWEYYDEDGIAIDLSF